MDIPVTIRRRDGSSEQVVVTCRIDTLEEIEYFKNGGVLQYVLRTSPAIRRRRKSAAAHAID